MFDTILTALRGWRDPKTWIAAFVVAVVFSIIWGIQLNVVVIRLSEKTGSLEQSVKVLADTQNAMAVRMERVTILLESITRNVEDNRSSLRDIANSLMSTSKTQ